MQVYFPHDKPREQQQAMIDSVLKAVQNNEHYITHAPTGLGKTAGVLAPAVSYALENNKTVFFLTSRYTQHKLAIDTLREMRNKHNLTFGVSDIIAKKSLCLIPGLKTLSSSEFTSHCKKLREKGKCKYYKNTRKKDGEMTEEAQKAVDELADVASDVKVLKEIGEYQTFCPYEIATEAAKHAKVIIGDYYYLFHPQIRDSFFRRVQKKLKDCIVVVDEAHNLPDRIKELASTKLSTYIIRLAATEANNYECKDAEKYLDHIKTVLEGWNNAPLNEKDVSKNWFIEMVEDIEEYDEILNTLYEAQELVYSNQERSFISAVYEFMVAWQKDSEGFVRILAKEHIRNKPEVVLSNRCLDPQVLSKKVLDESHSVIAMSGTFKPLEFYRDMLGFSKDVLTNSFANPFPKQNSLHLVVPLTSTKYSERSLDQFKSIAQHCASMCNLIPGNVAIFFPGYALLNDVRAFFEEKSRKTVLCENPTASKEEREELLNQFKQYKGTGAVLLAVAAGSFGEGVDLPGDLLQGVIIVGLPLGKPDLETKKLIEYYDEKYKRGWDYGYIYPAFNRTLQNAGRCIRTQKDKGIIIYLDKRFSWSQYYKCFPDDINLQTTTEYKEMIAEFFDLYSF